MLELRLYALLNYLLTRLLAARCRAAVVPCAWLLGLLGLAAAGKDRGP